jgi:hypothetical protein
MRRMARLARLWICAAALATLAALPTAISAADLPASVTVSPGSGLAGAKLVATYSFTPKSSCSAYHKPVSWSFGTTKNWATSKAPSAGGGKCTSSTQAIAPPSGLSPGSYQVCGTDTAVSATAACATYTIKPGTPAPTPTPARSPSPSPKPTPKASPSPSPAHSPSPSPTATPGGTPSPAASPSAAPPAGGSGPDTTKTAGLTQPIPIWPFVVVLVFAVAIVSVWRYRSWLVGVFENVEVMGKSGADLETELLHHDENPAEGGEAEAKPPIEEY